MKSARDSMRKSLRLITLNRMIITYSERVCKRLKNKTFYFEKRADRGKFVDHEITFHNLYCPLGQQYSESDTYLFANSAPSKIQESYLTTEM